MPHQCVRCGTFYEDGSDQILKGCGNCDGKLFFFVKQDKLKEMKKASYKLSKKEKKQIEEDVYDLIGIDQTDKTVVLDLEAIRILKPGKYELDLVNLFKQQPLIYKLEEGKYMIDLPESFKKMSKKSQGSS